MIKQKDRVTFTERTDGEYDIPDFPSYTIDDELVVRSYYGGQMTFKTPKHHKSGNVYYNLYGYDERGIRSKYTFTPIRLYLCAKAGVSPIDANTNDFIFDHDVLLAKYPALIDGSARQRQTTVEAHKAKAKTPLEKQCAAIHTRIEEQQVMLRAIQTGDQTEILALIATHRASVYDFARQQRAGEERAQAVASAVVERTLRCIMQQQVPVANLPNYMLMLAKRILRAHEQV